MSREFPQLCAINHFWAVATLRPISLPPIRWPGPFTASIDTTSIWTKVIVRCGKVSRTGKLLARVSLTNGLPLLLVKSAGPTPGVKELFEIVWKKS